MSRDIVGGCLGTSLHFSSSFWEGRRWPAGLAVAGRVEGAFADQLSGITADDADVQVVHQQGDTGAGTGGAEPDVV